MELTLFVGDYAYSSWSLRGFLLLDAFGIKFQTRHAHMNTPEFEALKDEMAPSRLVPALRIKSPVHKDVMVWDSLAMAETLAELFPKFGHWPEDPAQRATARSIAAEMHSGFTALRGACPMNMRRAYAGFQPSDAVMSDLARLSEIWAHARSFSGAGPFLFGDFSVVDAFFAPVASRIATYGLPVDGEDGAYVAALLNRPSVRRWRSMGMADGHLQQHYEFDLPSRPNPHEPAVTGEVIPGLASENASCPNSGKPIEPDCVIRVGDRTVGYCNPFCAAKSAADPFAWAPTLALLDAKRP
ncbi:MAG: glutathione S-transferase [Pseudomonadota bacterium]